MQSSSAHHAPHYTAQALCAREKRAVVLPHAFGLRSIVAGWTWCATSMEWRQRQKLRRQRRTAQRIGGCDSHCDDNDAQHDRASHSERVRDVLIPPERLQEIASQACDAQPDPKKVNFRGGRENSSDAVVVLHVSALIWLFGTSGTFG